MLTASMTTSTPDGNTTASPKAAGVSNPGVGVTSGEVAASEAVGAPAGVVVGAGVPPQPTVASRARASGASMRFTGSPKLARRAGGYTLLMPSFIFRGATYEYLRPALKVGPNVVQSWEYRDWPKVEASVPLSGGASVIVYGDAMRWAGDQILVRWKDDAGHHHDAWLPDSGVRRLTASERDIIAYHACPPELRSVQWGNRLPGFLPE